jgi:hypothetical protein
LTCAWREQVSGMSGSQAHPDPTEPNSPSPSGVQSIGARSASLTGSARRARVRDEAKRLKRRDLKLKDGRYLFVYSRTNDA